MVRTRVLCFILCFSFITSSNKDKTSFQESKIFNGMARRIWDHPYMAALEENLDNFCGACQIAAKWLATAAHCFTNKSKDSVKVRIGSSFRAKGGWLYDISNVIPHPNYSEKSAINDLLLIELKDRVLSTKTHSPIKMAGPASNFPVGTKMTVPGWGILNEKNADPALLQTQDLQIVKSSSCIEAYRNYLPNYKLNLNPREFCASSKVTTACSGDSGGPGVIDGKLAGILSRGSYRCARSLLPSVFVRIPDFYFWIQRMISRSA